MSPREARLYLSDILQACADIRAFTRGMTSADDLTEDRRTMHAVIRNLEIIGEAARQMPKSVKEMHPEIPWLDIGDMRNVIAHQYFGVDLDIVWDIVRTQIPDLADQVKKIRTG